MSRKRARDRNQTIVDVVIFIVDLVFVDEIVDKNEIVEATSTGTNANYFLYYVARWFGLSELRSFIDVVMCYGVLTNRKHTK